MSSAGFPDEFFKYFTRETGTGERNPVWTQIDAAGKAEMMKHPELATLKTDTPVFRKAIFELS
jgi:hypothetical protein